MNIYRNGWTKDRIVSYVTNNFKGVSWSEDVGTCFYFHPNGILKSIAGLFIPETVYHINMEGYDIVKVIDDYDLSMPLEEFYMLDWQANYHDSLQPNDTLEYQIAVLVEALDNFEEESREFNLINLGE